MGLDVSCYGTATLVHATEHPRALSGPKPTRSEECFDTFTTPYVNPDFPDHADGIPVDSCWETERRDLHIHHSYGGYNVYREWLCYGALGVLPEVVWKDPDAWRGKPFFEQINFSDCEGVIGPNTAAKLAKDYREQREHMMAFFADPDRVFAAGYGDWQQHLPEKYDEWAAGFALVGDTGMVLFR